MLSEITVSLSRNRTNKFIDPQSERFMGGTVMSPYGIIPFDLYYGDEDEGIQYAIVVEGLPERLSDMFKIDAKRVLM